MRGSFKMKKLSKFLITSVLIFMGCIAVTSNSEIPDKGPIIYPANELSAMGPIIYPSNELSAMGPIIYPSNNTHNC